MEDAINPALPGTATDAAVIAMDNVNFYNVTLKNFAAPWTNRDQSVFVPHDPDRSAARFLGGRAAY